MAAAELTVHAVKEVKISNYENNQTHATWSDILITQHDGTKIEVAIFHFNDAIKEKMLRLAKVE